MNERGVRCPSCNAPPALRLVKGEPGADVVIDYKCHMPRCGRKYNVPVAELRKAA